MNDQYGKLIEPPPVSFSFGAPGWYVLAALLLSVVLSIAVLIWRHYLKNKYRTHALQWLDAKQQEYTVNNNYNALVYETTMLVKRIAISKYGRNVVAGKRKEAFIEYINSKYKAVEFNDADKTLLSDTIYTDKNIEQHTAEQFVSKARQWIKQHA